MVAAVGVGCSRHNGARVLLLVSQWLSAVQFKMLPAVHALLYYNMAAKDVTCDAESTYVGGNSKLTHSHSAVHIPWQFLC
jgi:hypothetical protein